MKSKELKTKIYSHAHSLILSLRACAWSFLITGVTYWSDFLCQSTQDDFSVNQATNTARLEDVFKNVSKELSSYGSKQEADQARFAAASVDFNWLLLTKRKEMTVELSKRSQINSFSTWLLCSLSELAQVLSNCIGILGLWGHTARIVMGKAQAKQCAVNTECSQVITHSFWLLLLLNELKGIHCTENSWNQQTDTVLLTLHCVM